MGVSGRNRRPWVDVVVGLVLLVVLIASITFHSWLFYHLGAVNCTDFWDPGTPGTPVWTEHWPKYCYGNVVDPAKQAGVAGMLFFAALLSAGAAFAQLFVIPRRKKRSVDWRATVGLATVAVVALWFWHDFFATPVY